MERNIKVTLEYEGTNYHGWQVQENSITIQQKIEEAILKLTSEKVRITGAGRTDAGVHARGQVANFVIKKKLTTRQIVGGLNAYLPDDVVIKSAEEVSKDFNARFSAKGRVYQYYICLERTAIKRKFCWQIFQKLNSDILNLMSEILLGEQDFSSFARLETQSNHKKCIVSESVWRKDGDQLIYRIVANRFLHGMVRTIVGTMIDVALEKYKIDDFGKIFQAKDREEAGPAAPAKGLVLEEIIY